MRARISTLLSLLIALLVFMTTDAAECTDAEAASAESIWAEAAATSACSPYVTQTDPVYVSAPCTATDCVTVVEGVAKDLPDCTFSGVNNKIEVQNALTSCNGGDVEDAGSPTFATNAPAATTDSSTILSSSASSSALTPTNTILSSSSSASTSVLTPTSTAPSATCTTAEVKSMLDLYVSTARIDACTDDAVIDGYGVDILTECDSSCAGKIKDLADELPNCFYDYEYMNKKEDMLSQLDICEGISGYMSATIYADSSIAFSSSSGSALHVDSKSDSSNSELLRSGDDPSDATLDSSNVGIKSNTSPPSVYEKKFLRWLTLVVGIVVAFMS